MNAYINQLDNILFVKKIQNPVGPSFSEKRRFCRISVNFRFWHKATIQ